MAKCPKCGAKIFSPAIYDVTISNEDINNTTATVQYREFIRFTLNNTVYQFDAGQINDVAYSLIVAALEIKPNVLYFHKNTQRTHFLLVYPQYEGYNL